MKQINLLITFFVLLILSGCSKDKETFEVYPLPDWTIQTPELFPNSLTAIVSIPDNINTYAQDDDVLAAFIGDECRGIGNLVTADEGAKRVYYITVRASDTENGNIVFKYYNSRLSYLYKAITLVPFEIDATYGTFDEPIILDLEQI